jgi:hypothetical protein
MATTKNRKKSGWIRLALLTAVATAVGCPASQSQLLAQKQDAAMQSALQRGRFDLNCPGATASVLSSDYIQPRAQGPWVSGINRVEYTIGVAGCDQRTTYVVLCQEGTDTCFASSPDARFQR